MKNCITGLREVWGGRAPGSAGMINASRASAKVAMSCSGARMANRHAEAVNAGGKHAPRTP